MDDDAPNRRIAQSHTIALWQQTRPQQSAPAVSSVVRYWTSEAGPNARGLQKAFAYVSPRDQQASLARETIRRYSQARAWMISVWTKSSPLNSRGSPVVFASA